MRRIIAAFFTLMVCLFGGSDAQAAGVVEEVTAKIDAAAPIPVLVRRRMETTVSAIGAQLLAGRQIADVEASRAQQEAVIHEVFDKVLVGYSVERVSLTPGETSVVEIRLVPWADVIGTVRVDVTVEGMPPAVEEMARRDLADVGSVFGAGMQGLPVAASDWTNGVLKRSLQEYMEAHLPEFRADFDVEPGAEAKVALTVYPKLPVVRTVDLSMRSDSVPNFTLLGHRNIMQENANMLIGVPVAFVERHEAEFSEMFAASLDSQSDFRALGLHTKVTMRPGRDMSLMSRSDTKDYLIRLEGWADISHKGQLYDVPVPRGQTVLAPGRILRADGRRAAGCALDLGSWLYAPFGGHHAPHRPLRYARGKDDSRRGAGDRAEVDAPLRIPLDGSDGRRRAPLPAPRFSEP